MTVISPFIIKGTSPISNMITGQSSVNMALLFREKACLTHNTYNVSKNVNITHLKPTASYKTLCLTNI